MNREWRLPGPPYICPYCSSGTGYACEDCNLTIGYGCKCKARGLPGIPNCTWSGHQKSTISKK